MFSSGQNNSGVDKRYSRLDKTNLKQTKNYWTDCSDMQRNCQDWRKNKKDLKPIDS